MTATLAICFQVFKPTASSRIEQIIASFQPIRVAIEENVGKQSLTETHLGCGELVAGVAGATAASANVAMPGGWASEVSGEVELGLETGSRVAGGGGTVESSLMTDRAGGKTGKDGDLREAWVGARQMPENWTEP